MPKSTRKQHYVPRLLLKNFSPNGVQVWEALFLQKDSRIYITNTVNAMAARDTYEHPLLANNTLENYFETIETRLVHEINIIVEEIEELPRTNPDLSHLKTQIDAILHEFLVLYYRSGALLTEFKHDGRSKDLSVLKLLEKISNWPYLQELSKSLVKTYDFALLKSDTGFLVSDQCVSTCALGIKVPFTNISNRHMGLKDVLILIPLSWRYYAAYFHASHSFGITSKTLNSLCPETTDHFNRVIVNNAYQKCAGADEHQLKKACSAFEKHNPHTIYVKYDDGSGSMATQKKEVFFYEDDRRAWDIFLKKPFLISEYRMLQRNDPCACKSKKKFKKCCEVPFRIVESILADFPTRNTKPARYVPNGTFMVEESIFMLEKSPDSTIQPRKV